MAEPTIEELKQMNFGQLKQVSDETLRAVVQPWVQANLTTILSADDLAFLDRVNRLLGFNGHKKER